MYLNSDLAIDSKNLYWNVLFAICFGQSFNNLWTYRRTKQKDFEIHDSGMEKKKEEIKIFEKKLRISNFSTRKNQASSVTMFCTVSLI